MRLLKEERGISLVEVVASIVLITIILISFFSFFVQSKKTHVASESIVDATYIAQKEMEELYGIISSQNKDWLEKSQSDSLTLNGTNFIVDATVHVCETKCKKLLSVDDPDHWIQLTANKDYKDSLVNVIINVPKRNSSAEVRMESIFTWGIKP